jgi:lipoprotein-anchoring transpeptidase ErfK/SrfK
MKQSRNRQLQDPPRRHKTKPESDTGQTSESQQPGWQSAPACDKIGQVYSDLFKGLKLNKKHFLRKLWGLALTGTLLLSVVNTAAAQTPTVDTTSATAAATESATTMAAAPTADPVLPTTTQSLCLPYLDGAQATNCLQAGPAQALSNLAAQGITFPAEPLTFTSPSIDLNNIPYTYARVNTTDAIPMYASVEDAVAGNVKEMMPEGKFRYVSLMQKDTGTDGNSYYQIANEDWIAASDVNKVAVTYLQGVLINQYPQVPFGWIVQSGISSYTTPGYNGQSSGKTYNRQDVVLCYGSQTVDGEEWVKIGPDEWIDHKYVGRVLNNPTPPAGVTNGRWIEVNLYEQVMTVYDNSKMIFATLVSSGGKPFYTRPGLFKIYRKVDFEYMTGAFEADRSDYYYIEQVPYIMYFDDARALHGAYWNNYLGNQGSHGCVNLSVADAHWLYEWANEGDAVYVWDPSGKTPTDPSLYGAGAF